MKVLIEAPEDNDGTVDLEWRYNRFINRKRLMSGECLKIDTTNLSSVKVSSGKSGNVVRVTYSQEIAVW